MKTPGNLTFRLPFLGSLVEADVAHAVIGAAVDSPESEIAARIDSLAADPGARRELVHLLREDHPIYAQRGSAAVARLRGWILLALARAGLADDALLFAVEELDTGLDPYPVAAAARALRSYPNPSGAFAPFLLHALANMAGRDEPLSFERFGEYSSRPGAEISATREILATLTWLGAHARAVLPDLERLRNEPGVLSRASRPAFNRAVSVIRGADDAEDGCCALPEGLRHVFSWTRREDERPLARTTLEDHDGSRLTYDDFFLGKPAIVVFFYTRCDNPLKCSLTVAKLGRVQGMLEERGLAARIRTAAITYDPGFDSPQRLRAFGERRGLRLGPEHRMFRSCDGMDTLRRHFRLGVNFVESLVNRHRVEAYVLDATGRIAISFERLRWSEQEVVDAAVRVLNREDRQVSRRPTSRPGLLAALPALALAVLPKCPICWATYLSALGIAGLERVAALSWLQPVLVGGVIVNVGAAWFRSRTTRRVGGACLASLGALAIVGSRFGVPTAALGVALTLAGALVTVAESSRQFTVDSQQSTVES